MLATSAVSSTTSSPANQTYTSFLANLFHQRDDTSPTDILLIMTLAISRGSSGINNAGELAFGGYLSLNNSVVNAGQAVTVLMAFSNFTSLNGVVYDDTSMQYIVSVDNIYAANIGIAGFQFNPISAFYMYIPQSNTAISLPPSLASAVNSMFVPPGFLASDNSTFYLHRNATVPSLNFVINNLTFLINAVDLRGMHLSRYASARSRQTLMATTC